LISFLKYIQNTKTVRNERGMEEAEMAQTPAQCLLFRQEPCGGGPQKES
jgi:hypothetical protein